jgi:cold shock CspA family protein
MFKVRGRLTTWNADKGFGFIRSEGRDTDVFVHIRDFGNISRAPRVGDVVSFQPMRGDDGRLRAADVAIDGVPRLPPMKPTFRAAKVHASSKGLLGKALSVLGCAVVAAVVYSKIAPTLDAGHLSSLTDEAAESAHAPTACDGRRYCSQMTSCDEATNFLRHCPGTEMDGDGDGVPCESQWCN